MSDVDRQMRDFEDAATRRTETGAKKPVQRPEQLFDEIEIEEDER